MSRKAIGFITSLLQSLIVDIEQTKVLDPRFCSEIETCLLNIHFHLGPLPDIDGLQLSLIMQELADTMLRKRKGTPREVAIRRAALTDIIRRLHVSLGAVPARYQKDFINRTKLIGAHTKELSLQRPDRLINLGRCLMFDDEFTTIG